MNKIEYKEIFKQRNIDLKIDSHCHECISHKKTKSGQYIRFHRNGFDVLHRWIYWKNTGETPECVMHLCDNPSCINIKHLKSGTISENNKDRHNKGRTIIPDNNGVKCGGHILSELEVLKVREFIKLGYSIQNIANNFKVSRYTIYDIKNKRTWRQLKEAL